MVQHTKYFLMQIRGSSMILLGMRRECPATALGVHRVTELILEVSNSEAHVFMELDQGLKENIPSLLAGSLIDRLEGKALRTGPSSFLLLKRDVHQSQNLTAGADLQNNLDGPITFIICSLGTMLEGLGMWVVCLGMGAVCSAMYLIPLVKEVENNQREEGLLIAHCSLLTGLHFCS
jgi:hypothetical protein